MADSFTSALAERLLRRGTRPVGVIDVRPAQERYERATEWPRQHVAMLDRAAARQQSDAQPGQDQRLLLAARPLEATGALRDMIPGDAVMDARRSSPNAPAFSPASLARIAARQRSSAAPGSAPVPAAAATADSRETDLSRAPSRGETIVGPAMRAVTRSSADLPLPSRAGMRPADRDGQDEPSPGRRGDEEAPPMPTSRAVTLTESTPAAATESAAASIAAPAPAVRAGETPPATIDTPQVFVQRRYMAPHERTSPSAAAAPLQNAAAPALSIASPPAHADSDMSLARTRRVTTTAETAARAPAFDPGVAAGRPAAAPASPAAALAVANPVAAPLPTADREPSLSLPSAARSARSVRQPAQAGTTAVAPAAAARGTTDAAPLQLVWRRGAAHDTTSPAAAGHVTSAQGAAAPVAAATGWTSAGAADPAAAMTSSAGAARESGGGMELEQIVEEVMRRMAEIQLVERERRGDPWL